MVRLIAGLSMVVSMAAGLAVQPVPAVASHNSCIALHEAVFMNDPEDVREILGDGVAAGCRDDVGMTPMMTAAEGGSYASFKILINTGADLKSKDAFGETVLTRLENKLDHFRAPNARTYRLLYEQMIALVHQTQSLRNGSSEPVQSSEGR